MGFLAEFYSTNTNRLLFEIESSKLESWMQSCVPRPLRRKQQLPVDLIPVALMS
jgi:hypothetical protein